MSLGSPTAEVAIVETGSSENGGSYVDWGAIIAGAVLASAISFVLITFGSALGLSLTSPYEGESSSLWGIAIAAGLWLLWVQISSFGAGAYLAGRLRRRVYDASEHESDIRDAAHGLLVWALGTLVGAFIAFMTVSAATTTAANAVSSAAGGAASAVGSIAQGAGNAADNPALAGYVDRLFRGPNNQPVGQETRSEVGRIFSNALVDGEFPDEDRNYVAGLIAQNTGVAPEEARARVDQVVNTAQEAEQAARDAAEAARKTSLVVAFFTAASLAVSAAVAFFAAGLGGRHRDEGVTIEGLGLR